MDQAAKKIKDHERLILVVVDQHFEEDAFPIDDHQSEMKALIEACEAEVSQSIVFRLKKIQPKYYIGTGQMEQIKEFLLGEEVELDGVVFSVDLKGSHQRNIEEFLGVKAIDRTQVILDIFARRARTRQAQCQVELAQLQYLLPRLVGKGLTMSRLGGGIGTLGPGETQLEVDRRKIGLRIAHLKKLLDRIVQSRLTTRMKRAMQNIPIVTLVGYTNAGKSTLLNALTGGRQKTENAVFTTLDSVSRRVDFEHNQSVILNDTVGFVHDLPHHLIESFKATLEEVREADLLLFVVDVSHPHYLQRYEAVKAVLDELLIDQKPMLVVLNKIDCMKELDWAESVKERFEHAVCISAKSKQGFDVLTESIERLAFQDRFFFRVILPSQRMDILNIVYDVGEVFSVEYLAEGIKVYGAVPQTHRKYLQSFPTWEDESIFGCDETNE